jgi:hypothetical protein
MASTTSGAKPQSVRRVDITAAAMFEGAELYDDTCPFAAWPYLFGNNPQKCIRPRRNWLRPFAAGPTKFSGSPRWSAKHGEPPAASVWGYAEGAGAVKAEALKQPVDMRLPRDPSACTAADVPPHQLRFASHGPGQEATCRGSVKTLSQVRVASITLNGECVGITRSSQKPPPWRRR